MSEPNLSTAKRSGVAPVSRSAIGRASGAAGKVVAALPSLHATGRFLRQQVWMWPIVAALLLGTSGWWVYSTVELAMENQRAADLNAVVDATAKGVVSWMNEQETNVQMMADDEGIRGLAAELANLEDINDGGRTLVLSKAQAQLRSRLTAKGKIAGYVGYFIVSPSGVVVGADQDAPIGGKLLGYRKEVFDAANAGKTRVSVPYRSPLLLADERGEVRANLPTMFAVAPLKATDGRPIAALGLRIRPDDTFTKLLQSVRFGDSGETFAFDRNAMLVTQSRFDDELKQVGLLPDLADAQSILTLELRDPGVNMSAGERPAVRRSEQPLTRVAQEATQGKSGVDVDGYRGYRGVMKMGAWRWLPEFDLGIATEINAEEALRPVRVLKTAFAVLMGLLLLAAIGLYVAMLYIARQQRAIQKATLAAKQLGQYQLEEKLGAGGMGTVYRARHAMLRRPTAVKLLDLDKMNPSAVARFEREVQMTCTLTHPNTVAIFDYGRTPEGIFYYAMEYLEGLTLEDLVNRHGPLPEGRVVHLLRQVCGSLAEAHANGLVHRDIKPANIFVTNRGGMSDFVKVLDFGLVKTLDAETQANMTSPNALMGTPLYLSPEAASQPETVDARADVYAVGAVAYFLLTGSPVFTGATVMEICMKHVKEPPQPPSARIHHAVDHQFEALILRCLAKSPNERPRDAAALCAELDASPLRHGWTSVEAADWWFQRQAVTIQDAASLLLKVDPSNVSGATIGYPGDSTKISQ